jgi:hypothetical protein
MKILDASLSLAEMESVLEYELLNDKNNIRIIRDLELSYEDYKILTLKLKGLVKYKGIINIFDRYKLCTIVASVFSLHFDKEDRINLEIIKKPLENLPQHQIRYVLSLFTSAFSDCGVDSYHIDTSSMDGFLSLIAAHAGITSEFENEFCSLLDDSLNHKDMNTLEIEIYSNLSTRMTEVFKYLDNDLVSEIIHTYREIFVDCKLNHLSQEEILDKYPLASSKIIELYVKWCECAEEQKEELISLVR